MLITKIIGAFFIIGATTLYGYGLTRELTCRIRTLKSLKRAFFLLRSEIRYGMETLTEAFMHIGERCGTTETLVRDFFWAVGTQLRENPQTGLKKLWEEKALLLAKEAHLNGNEADRLVQSVQSLGYLDVEQQLNSIDLYLENVEEDIETLTKKYEGTCRMYTGLGMMAGLFLTIVLV